MESGFAAFNLPPKGSVGYLDQEIADEGMKVEMTAGEIPDTGLAPRLAIPDLSRVKSVAKYFGRSGYVVYPAYIFNRMTGEEKIVRDQDEAAKFGVVFRKATNDERARYGRQWVWDWKDEGEWRPHRDGAALTKDGKPPRRLDQEHGKTVIAPPPNPELANHALVRELMPQMAALFAQAIGGANAPGKPAEIDAKDWEEFQAFKVWKAAAAASKVVAERVVESDADDDDIVLTQEDGPLDEALALSPEQEKEIWLKRAEELGLKVDGRWGLDRIKTEIEKAAQ